jgi:hypothetical protein
MSFDEELARQLERDDNNVAPDDLEAQLAEEAGLTFAGWGIDDDCDDKHNSRAYPQWQGKKEEWDKFDELKELNNL